MKLDESMLERLVEFIVAISVGWAKSLFVQPVSRALDLERELKEIGDRLDAFPYKNMLNLMVEEEELLPDEKKAVESKDGIASEEELLKALKE